MENLQNHNFAGIFQFLEIDHVGVDGLARELQSGINYAEAIQACSIFFRKEPTLQQVVQVGIRLAKLGGGYGAVLKILANANFGVLFSGDQALDADAPQDGALIGGLAHPNAQMVSYTDQQAADRADVGLCAAMVILMDIHRELVPNSNLDLVPVFRQKGAPAVDNTLALWRTFCNDIANNNAVDPRRREQARQFINKVNPFHINMVRRIGSTAMHVSFKNDLEFIRELGPDENYVVTINEFKSWDCSQGIENHGQSVRLRNVNIILPVLEEPYLFMDSLRLDDDDGRNEAIYLRLGKLFVANKILLERDFEQRNNELEQPKPFFGILRKYMSRMQKLAQRNHVVAQILNFATQDPDRMRAFCRDNFTNMKGAQAEQINLMRIDGDLAGFLGDGDVEIVLDNGPLIPAPAENAQ